MKTQIFKCAYNHCKHESCEIPQDSIIKIGNRYYHDDCAKNKENILKIKELYYQKISNTVVMAQLLNTINNIVFVKNVDSDYLLFALNFCIDNRIKINSPYGLHYIIDNSRVKAAWNNQTAKKMIKQMKFNVSNAVENTTKIKLKDNRTGFGDIFG